MAEESLLVRGIKRMLHGAYRRCDLIADIGECMRGLLQEYGSKARQLAITPWALTEPAVSHRELAGGVDGDGWTPVDCPFGHYQKFAKAIESGVQLTLETSHSFRV